MRLLVGQRRGFRVGLFLLSVGLMLQIVLPLVHIRSGNGVHFAVGFLVGLGGAVIVASTLKKGRPLPEQG